MIKWETTTGKRNVLHATSEPHLSPSANVRASSYPLPHATRLEMGRVLTVPARGVLETDAGKLQHYSPRRRLCYRQAVPSSPRCPTAAQLWPSRRVYDASGLAHMVEMGFMTSIDPPALQRGWEGRLRAAASGIFGSGAELRPACCALVSLCNLVSPERTRRTRLEIPHQQSPLSDDSLDRNPTPETALQRSNEAECGTNRRTAG